MVERYYDESVLQSIRSEQDKNDLAKLLVEPNKTRELNEKNPQDLINLSYYSTGLFYEGDRQSLLHDVKKANEEAQYLTNLQYGYQPIQP